MHEVGGFERFSASTTAALLDTSLTIATSDNESQLLHAACANALERGRLALAWYGRARGDASGIIEPLASAGVATAYLDNIAVTLDESETGRGPVGVAIRTGELVSVQDMRKARGDVSGPDLRAWLDRIDEYGLRSCTSIPVFVDGVVDGVLSIYSTEPDAFGAGSRSIHLAMAQQIGSGIKSLRQSNRIISSLMETVNVLGAMVDARDVYTAGHQTKVSVIGANVARRLGMSEFEIQGIRVAGMLHDIGKVAVPLEVLLKPAKLSPIERRLVETHAARGEEILQPASFPWPIATIVGAHHERLDGSGYPHGLSGSDISMTTRIVTVADVYDAMSAARPYRVGFSTDAVLTYLGDRAGSVFDASVVAALASLTAEGSLDGE